MKDIMIDLETMGTNSDAPIVAIGACVVSEDKDEASQFYAKTKPDVLPEYSTIAWWLRQASENPSAAVEIIDAIEKGRDMRDALAGFSTFVLGIGADSRVWSKGSNFDIVVLENAYARFDMLPPWGFRNVRCFRTIEQHFSEGVENPLELEGEAVAHHALNDARWQAQKLAAIIQANANNPAFKL